MCRILEQLTEELNDGRVIRTFIEDVTTTSEWRDDHEGDTDPFRHVSRLTYVS